MTVWRVRAATAADAARVVEIRVKSWQHAYRDILPSGRLSELRPSGGAVARWAELAAASPPTRLFVAVDGDDQPVAFCLVGDAREDSDRHPSLPTGELWALYADPAVLGTGAGTALHAAGMDHLAQHGFARAVLWVLADNDAGQRFYRSHGWRPDGGSADFEWGGVSVIEVRYARSLVPSVQPSSV